MLAAKPLPAALRAMIQLVTAETGLRSSADVPKDVPDRFIRVRRVGGSQDDLGIISSPRFTFEVYAREIGDCEELCEQLLAVLRAAQFSFRNGVQFRKWYLEGGPGDFPDPDVDSRRRWQFTGTFTLSQQERT